MLRPPRLPCSFLFLVALPLRHSSHKFLEELGRMSGRVPGVEQIIVPTIGMPSLTVGATHRLKGLHPFDQQDMHHVSNWIFPYVGRW